MSEYGPGSERLEIARGYDGKLPDSDITWAGPGRHADEFCLGLEDGWVTLFPQDGNNPGTLRFEYDNPEPVNGVAFIGLECAISTRREVVFLSIPERGQNTQRCIFPHGAHGVIATAGGSFVAPLGPSGLMTTRPTASELQAINCHRIHERPLNYYKSVSIVSRTVPEVIVCAARKDGIVTTPVDSDRLTGAWVMTLPDLDVVDVYPLGTNLESPAIIALGKDGTLALFHDVLRNAAPTTIQYEGVQGVAYRVLVVQGNVVLLTSEGLYVLHGLADRFLQGAPLDVPIPTFLRPMKAIDANVADDRWLLIVESNRVIGFDVPRYALEPVTGETGWSEAAFQGDAISQRWQMSNDLPLAAEQRELIAA